MCVWRLPVFLETPETHLCDCNHAHGDARRFLTGGDEFTSAALPAVSDRPLPAQVARARTLRANGLEEFLSRFPMPTILLRWNLKPIYQNRAAREFCALWEKGPEEAQLTKATSPIPSEILDRCRLLKQQWAHAQRPIAPQTRIQRRTGASSAIAAFASDDPSETTQFSSVAQPHFLIECEDLRRQADQSERAGSELPFAASCSTDQAGTRSCPTCL